LYSTDEIEKFKKILAHEKPYDKGNSCVESVLILYSHGLDLMRCKDPESYGMLKTMKNVFGEEDGMQMIEYTRCLMEATGETSLGLSGIMADNKVYTLNYNKFEKCSVSVEEGIKAIETVAVLKVEVGLSNIKEQVIEVDPEVLRRWSEEKRKLEEEKKRV